MASGRGGAAEAAAVGDLNRVQPAVKIVSVKRRAKPDVAKVTVGISPAEGEFQRDGKTITRTTDVYDLRLFRGVSWWARSRS